jgi:hypothetical protein
MTLRGTSPTCPRRPRRNSRREQFLLDFTICLLCYFMGG